MNEKLIELLKQDDNMKLLVDCVENGIREIKELNGIKAENENQGEIKNE